MLNMRSTECGSYKVGKPNSNVSSSPTSSELGSNRQQSVSGKVPYQQRAFSDFCAIVGRLFYDDACIILLDFLVREQRAYTESDIREHLKWKDSLLHQKLYFLEKQLLVQREQNCEKGNKSPIYWRISPHIVLSVDWHYKSLLTLINEQVQASHRLHEFECTYCKLKYSALDAAYGDRALDDEHPLCRKCGERLSFSNSLEAKQEMRDKQERALKQLVPLKASIDRVKNMEPPVYETFTRADKNEKKRQLENVKSNGGVKSTVSISGNTDDLKNESLSGESSVSSNITSSNVSLKHSLNPKEPIGSTKNKTAAGATNIKPTQVSRVIPWFDKGSASQQRPAVAAAVNRRVTLAADTTTTTNTTTTPLIPTQQTVNTFGAVGRPYTSGATARNKTDTGQGVVFNLYSSQDSKKRKLFAANKNPETQKQHILAGNDGLPQGNKSAAHIFEFAKQVAAPQQLKSVAINGAVQRQDSDLLDIATLASMSMKLLGKTENTKNTQEPEIEVAALGKRIKVSEVTEATEDSMTDAEYTHYCALIGATPVCG